MGAIAFGIPFNRELSRVPKPPARMIASILASNCKGYFEGSSENRCTPGGGSEQTLRNPAIGLERYGIVAANMFDGPLSTPPASTLFTT